MVNAGFGNAYTLRALFAVSLHENAFDTINLILRLPAVAYLIKGLAAVLLVSAKSHAYVKLAFGEPDTLCCVNAKLLASKHWALSV